MIQKDNHQKTATAAQIQPAASPASCWVLTDGKAGDEAQCIGVAEALGLPYELRRVRPRAPFSWVMPFGPIDPREAETVEGSPIAPPYPDLVIASGRRSIAYLRRVRAASNGKTFTVCLKDPRSGSPSADLIWVPAHDRLRGNNVLVSTTAPHRFSAGKLAALRAAAEPAIERLPAPRVAVLVGGDSRHHRFSKASITAFVAGLTEWAQVEKASLLITASRRTPADLAAALESLARSGPHLFWDGTGDNPLPAFLAKADALVVTADSTNMIGEAAASGKPIHVFHPAGGHRKIDRFLGTLATKGVIHPFPGPLKTTTYEPIDATPWIADEILRAYAHRQAGK